jgi:dienelactone hydrolase
MRGVLSSWRRVAFALLIVTLFASRPAWTHARAAALLLRVSGDTSHAMARLGVHDVSEENTTLSTPSGQVRARYYVPLGESDPPALVVCHGVHHLGIDEPRMMKFARAIAGAGVLVFTPEMKELTDYRVDSLTIGTIGRAALSLRTRAGRSEVGVLGLSFAGGLALLAATDPQFARAIDFVVAVGAHDDLERVARFFVTDEIPEANGDKLHLHAHDYGAVVLIHMYAQDFFAPRDIMAARESLRLWLWEKFDDARAEAKKLSYEGQQKMGLIFTHHEDALRPDIERVIAAHTGDMQRVSPHGALDGLRARVFLLHGEGDSVIPASETRWLAQDAPVGAVAQALVSRAIVHVDLEGSPTWRERYDIVHLLAGVLDAAEAEGRTGPR